MTSLLKPLKWVLPLIFSLPKESLSILGAPMPIFAGVRATKAEFQLDIAPVHCVDTEGLVVYLDLEGKKFSFLKDFKSKFSCPQFKGKVIGVKSAFEKVKNSPSILSKKIRHRVTFPATHVEFVQEVEKLIRKEIAVQIHHITEEVKQKMDDPDVGFNLSIVIRRPHTSLNRKIKGDYRSF